MFPTDFRGARAARVLALAAVLACGAARAAADTVLVLGDSLSAGYGIAVDAGWVALLGERLEARGYSVVNASISGDTTRGGLARLPRALERHTPSLVIVELGGNDGLRGILIEETRANLARIIERSRAAGARVLLVGMRIPPNYGPAYTRRFEGIFRELAGEMGVPLVPFLLEGVALDDALMQRDGIHPVARAQPKLLDNVWPHLEPLL